MARFAVLGKSQNFMNPALKPFVESFIVEEQLPEEYLATVEHWFLPMVDEVLQNISSHNGTYVIGVSGCQGSGKSTLASLLVMVLNKMLGLRCVNLSIDDFYLTHQERQILGEEIHPLLATRGVPGTHDISLAINTILGLKGDGQVAVPRFDKAIDDRSPEQQWPAFMAPLDVIVLEGWCLSVDAQEQSQLDAPVNELEANEDADGVWRKYVNDAIGERYAEIYQMIDFLIMLKAPSFEKVYEWRQNQEDKLSLKNQSEDTVGEKSDDKNHIMTSTQLKRFIQHYERVTRHGLDTLPEKSDVVFQLTDRQTIGQRLK